MSEVAVGGEELDFNSPEHQEPQSVPPRRQKHNGDGRTQDAEATDANGQAIVHHQSETSPQQSTGLILGEKGFDMRSAGDLLGFSRSLAKSKLIPVAYQNKPEDITVCILWGKEIGLNPITSLTSIAVINGKASIYGDAALALVKKSKLLVDIKEYFEGEGDGLTAVCETVRKGQDSKHITTFSIADAKKAGLLNKQGPWSSYPKRMLQMRARGFNLRDQFPDVLMGLILVEEAQDYPMDYQTPEPPGKSRPVIDSDLTDPQ